MHKLLNIIHLKTVGAIGSITIDDVIHHIEFYTNAKLND